MLTPTARRLAPTSSSRDATQCDVALRDVALPIGACITGAANFGDYIAAELRL